MPSQVYPLLTSSGQFALGASSSVKQTAIDNLIELFDEPMTGATYDTSVIKAWNGATLNFSAVNDRLEVTHAATYRGIYLDNTALGLVDDDHYLIEVDWEDNTTENLLMYSAWSDSTKPRASFLSDNQLIIFHHVQSSAGDGANYSPVIIGVGAAKTFWVNRIRVFKVGPQAGSLYGSTDVIAFGSDINVKAKPNSSVIIGNSIIATDVNDQVLIGQAVQGADAELALGCVAIGHDATVAYVSTFGGSNSNGHRVAIGDGAKAGCWRGTAIGGAAQALNTSATAVGCGAVSEVSHGEVFGRGGYIPTESGVANCFVTSAQDMYLNNGWGHYCDAVPSGISIAEVTGANTATASTLHGKDAFDARATPSEINIAGGDLQLAAGRGTGSGASGKVSLQTAPSGASGASKNALATAAQVDADTTAGNTRFLLYDIDAAALVRVSVGAADSGGVGYKVLRVPN